VKKSVEGGGVESSSLAAVEGSGGVDGEGHKSRTHIGCAYSGVEQGEAITTATTVDGQTHRYCSTLTSERTPRPYQMPNKKKRREENTYIRTLLYSMRRTCGGGAGAQPNTCQPRRRNSQIRPNIADGGSPNAADQTTTTDR